MAYAKAAIDSVKTESRNGTLLRALADYYLFTDLYFGDQDDETTRLAKESYNPYTYLRSGQYQSEHDRLSQAVSDSHSLFAAVITTWALYPDALMSRFDQLPMTEDRPEHVGPSMAPVVIPSREKQTVKDITAGVYSLVTRMLNPDGEGQGLVGERLKIIAPRFYQIKVGMGLS